MEAMTLGGAKCSRRDVAEIVVGSCLMAFPTATAEDIWRLGETLSFGRVLMIAATSIVVLSVLIYELHYGAHRPGDRREFLQRVLSTYGLTLAISAFILLGVDHLDFIPHPIVAFTRTILVAFPASFAATAVDTLR